MMSVNHKKEDLRVQKTHKYLRSALETLLDKKNFKQITVNDLCEESLISRAAFYSHFKDKYDLLQSWLNELTQKYETADARSILEVLLYDKHKKTKNIVSGADAETLAMIHNFAIKVMERLFKHNGTEKTGSEYTILSSFCVGGLTNFLSWQIEHCYPQELSGTSCYLEALLENLIEWDAKNRSNFRS